MGETLEFKPYEVHEFSWGSAIKTAKGDWESIYLKPEAQKVDVSKMKVVLHENGIEWLGLK